MLTKEERQAKKAERIAINVEHQKLMKKLNHEHSVTLAKARAGLNTTLYEHREKWAKVEQEKTEPKPNKAKKKTTRQKKEKTDE